MPTNVAHAPTAHLVSRIWQRDSTAFLPPNAPDEARAAVSHRLGWLDAPSSMAPHLAAVRAVHEALRADGLTDIYLLGMGGSSLCAEVLRDLAPATPGSARLVVLDSTDEYAIGQATAGLNSAHACVIVASKSGSTIEVTSLERHFWSVLSRARGSSAGRHFVAITDPSTSLERLAAERGYRHTFVNPPDIGGRFSALSLFGLVPATLIGLDSARLLADAREMASACHLEGPDNPALALGAFMAETASAGRDKLTVVLPNTMAALGPWIEQLVAESTGKDGRGILPVVGEALGEPQRYGPDRAFVVTSAGGAAEQSDAARRLQAAGHPVFRIAADEGNIGREFFRWEFATAIAGAALGVNPFDEPNVRQAKDRTERQLDARRRVGRFVFDPPLESRHGFSWRGHEPSGVPSSGAGRYIAILDYLPTDPASRGAVEACRSLLRSRVTSVITHGMGPRYLHSTGQYHKGGPNTGVFLLLTGDDPTETPVPDTDYTFSALKQAQALGDFEALVSAGRRVVHYHVHDASAGLDAARQDLLERLEQ
jgi:glucose-6-phosphate isomerase